MFLIKISLFSPADAPVSKECMDNVQWMKEVSIRLPVVAAFFSCFYHGLRNSKSITEITFKRICSNSMEALYVMNIYFSPVL